MRPKQQLHAWPCSSIWSSKVKWKTLSLTRLVNWCRLQVDHGGESSIHEVTTVPYPVTGISIPSTKFNGWQWYSPATKVELDLGSKKETFVYAVEGLKTWETGVWGSLPSRTKQNFLPTAYVLLQTNEIHLPKMQFLVKECTNLTYPITGMDKQHNSIIEG